MSLNFRFAGQHCSVWQIKQDLPHDFFVCSYSAGGNGLFRPSATKIERRSCLFCRRL
jgi:hypothetical protein